MNSTEYLLKLLNWQFFLNLSFSNSHLGSVSSRAQAVKVFLDQWARREQHSMSELPAFHRWERGETRGRPHYHGLLGGFTQAESVSLSRCFRERAIWKRHNGISVIRLFAESQRDSVCSYLTADAERTAAKNSYEMRKSHYAESSGFNWAAWKLLTRTCNVPQFAVARTT
jgi:hypothetical protein